MGHGSKRLLLSIGLLVASVCPVAAPRVQAQAIHAVVDLGKNGGGVAADPYSDRVYVAVEGEVRSYHAGTYALLSSVPLPQSSTPCRDVAVNPVTNRVYAVGWRVYAVDLGSNTVVHNLNQHGTEVAVNPSTNRVYITDWVYWPSSYAVRVLDGATGAWLPDIPLGATSRFEEVHLAVNPRANRVYITFGLDDELRVLDGATHAELARIHVPEIGSVAVNPTNGRIYVASGTAGTLVFDGTTHAQVATIPKLCGRLRLNPVTNRLYGGSTASLGYVVRIADLGTNTYIGHVFLEGAVAAYDVHWTRGELFATHDYGSVAWVKKMTIIQDAAPGRPAPLPPLPRTVAALTLPANGLAVGVNAATNRVYVGMEGGVAVYDAATLAYLTYWNLAQGGLSPHIQDIGIDEIRNRVYAVDEGRTYVLDGSGGALLGHVAGGDEIAVNPLNGRLYIADESLYTTVPDRVYIWDANTISLVRRIDLSTGPTLQSVHVGVNPTTGYAYYTYSACDNLHILSPLTDQQVQEIDYASSGRIVVNPVTNRVYVWASRSNKSGLVMLDGVTHSELGLFEGLGGGLAVNEATNRLYSIVGAILTIADGATGARLGQVFLDSNHRGMAVHPALGRVYVSLSEGPVLAVVQDTDGSPTPTPTATPTVTPTATPRPPFTPTAWMYLPVLMRYGW